METPERKPQTGKGWFIINKYMPLEKYTYEEREEGQQNLRNYFSALLAAAKRQTEDEEVEQRKARAEELEVLNIMGLS